MKIVDFVDKLMARGYTLYTKGFHVVLKRDGHEEVFATMTDCYKAKLIS